MKASQIISHTNGSAPSAISIHPENGDDTITAPGKHSSHNEFARALSAFENQCEIKISVAGKTPLSATPSISRKMSISWYVRAKPHPTAQTAQNTSSTLMNFFGLQYFARCPPGICSARYPQ